MCVFLVEPLILKQDIGEQMLREVAAVGLNVAFPVDKSVMNTSIFWWSMKEEKGRKKVAQKLWIFYVIIFVV